jgi:hypothetical protein
MTMTQISSTTTRQLLYEAENLSLPELEQVVAQLMVLRARRRAKSLSPTETELLLKINQRLPSEKQARYDELIVRRRADQLTAEERDELLQLVEQIEIADAQRVEHLVALANLRGVSLRELMSELGIKPLPYA